MSAKAADAELMTTPKDGKKPQRAESAIREVFEGVIEKIGGPKAWSGKLGDDFEKAEKKPALRQGYHKLLMEMAKLTDRMNIATGDLEVPATEIEAEVRQLAIERALES